MGGTFGMFHHQMIIGVGTQGCQRPASCRPQPRGLVVERWRQRPLCRTSAVRAHSEAFLAVVNLLRGPPAQMEPSAIDPKCCTALRWGVSCIALTMVEMAPRRQPAYSYRLPSRLSRLKAPARRSCSWTLSHPAIL